MISSTEPDWSREWKAPGEWSPGKSLLKAIRDYQVYIGKSGLESNLRAKIAVLRHRWWSVISGADIPLNSKLGGGLRIPHPQGIVILPKATIGPNCLIFQQVTIGTNGKGAPEIGGHVDIGAGAKILGPVKIGAHARIGANAVVLVNVPEGATAIGVPARILFKD